MRALIRDYSRRRDVIADPFAGAGTTLLAASLEGRTVYGSERDKHAFEIARDRLELATPVSQAMVSR
jgi:DNA modification methylase